jgi:hypothetical protein
VDAHVALSLIRRCIDQERVILKKHFTARMNSRGLFWGDVLAVIDDPADVRTDGVDALGRPRWFISGLAPDGAGIELLCVIDNLEPSTVFITIYWED